VEQRYRYLAQSTVWEVGLAAVGALDWCRSWWTLGIPCIALLHWWSQKSLLALSPSRIDRGVTMGVCLPQQDCGFFLASTVSVNTEFIQSILSTQLPETDSIRLTRQFLCWAISRTRPPFPRLRASDQTTHHPSPPPPPPRRRALPNSISVPASRFACLPFSTRPTSSTPPPSNPPKAGSRRPQSLVSFA